MNAKSPFKYTKCSECPDREVRESGLVYCRRSYALIENPNTGKVYIRGCARWKEVIE